MITDDDVPEDSAPGWGLLARAREAMEPTDSRNPLGHLSDAELLAGLAEVRDGRSPQLRRDEATDEALARRYRHLSDSQLLGRLNELRGVLS